MFPDWTLIGMAVCGALAVLLLMYTLYIQSPRRQYLYADPMRYANHIRSLTTFVFALILLAFAFFVAGVPKENTPFSSVVQVDSTPTSLPIADNGGSFEVAITPTNEDENIEQTEDELMEETAEAALDSDPILTPENSGAFGESIATPMTETETIVPLPTIAIQVGPSAIEPTVDPNATAEVTPTPEVSPTPEATPTPSFTPTPIVGRKATVDTGGSTLWVRDIPGGQPVALMQNTDTLLIRNRSANADGALWKEVMTPEGLVGWVQLKYLVLE